MDVSRREGGGLEIWSLSPRPGRPPPFLYIVIYGPVPSSPWPPPHTPAPFQNPGRESFPAPPAPPLTSWVTPMYGATLEKHPLLPTLRQGLSLYFTLAYFRTTTTCQRLTHAYLLRGSTRLPYSGEAPPYGALTLRLFLYLPTPCLLFLLTYVSIPSTAYLL